MRDGESPKAFAGSIDPVHGSLNGMTNLTLDSVKVLKVARLAKPWEPSDALLTFIGVLENGLVNGTNFAKQKVVDGFILTVYKDSRKLPTVGCGHLVTTADKLKVGEKITTKQAQDFLKADIHTAVKAINHFVDVPLYQYEFDALVSVAFNTGRGGSIPLTKVVNAGDYKKIPDAIKKAKPKGNEWRRALEADLFGSGVYDAEH
jgi:lysozyme